jgi:hypothetical protein
VSRLVAAIGDFGSPTEGLDKEDLASSKRVLMLGRAPQRIDVLMRPDGLEWEGAWSRRIEDRYGDVALSFLSLDDLIAAKRAAGRPRDLADVDAPEAIRKLRNGQT